MLEIRPNCELCDCDLAPDSAAYICSFECTFCDLCTADKLDYTCPNCQGNLVKRPIRPAAKLKKFPASAERVTK